MTCTIHHFPAPAAAPADRSAAIVRAARAIIRSPERHSDEALHEACVALQTWGDGTDWLQADAMLLAMRLRARKRAREAAEARAKPQRGTIRKLLLAALLTCGLTWAGLVVVLSMGAM